MQLENLDFKVLQSKRNVCLVHWGLLSQLAQVPRLVAIMPATHDHVTRYCQTVGSCPC